MIRINNLHKTTRQLYIFRNFFKVPTEKRLERDAEIMRKKQEAAAAVKQSQEAGPTKKVVKVDPLKDL